MRARRNSHLLPIGAGLLLAASVVAGCKPPAPPPSKIAERPHAPVRQLLKTPRVEHPSSGGGGAPKPVASPTPTPERPVQARNPKPQPPDSTDVLLHNYQQALKQGFIDYNPPAVMTVGTAETIVVRVLRDKLPDLPSGAGPPPLPGQTVSKPLSVYPRMRVELTTNSGAAFAITPDSGTPTTQTVPDAGFAEWRWQVAPLLAGPDKTLVVTAWADLSEQQLAPILIQEFEAQVNVQVAPAPTAAQRAKTFVGNNWQWLWATIVLPLAGWLYRRFTRSKPTLVTPPKT